MDMNINEMLKGLLSGPSQEDRSQAINMGLLHTGLGLLGRRNIGDAGLLGLQAGQGYLDKSIAEKKANIANAAALMQLKKQMEQMDAIKGMYGGGASGTSNEGAPMGAGGISTPGGGQANLFTGQTAPAPTAGGPNLSQLGALRAAGVDITPDLKLWEARTPKMEVSNGFAFDPRRIGTGFLPGLKVDDKGNAIQTVVDPMGNPSVRNAPGSLAARGEQIRNEEGIKAGFDPFLSQLDSNNRPIPQTRGQFINRVTGGSPVGMGMTPGEKERDSELGKTSVKWEGDLSAAASSASSQINQLKDIEANLQNFNPSKLAPLKKAVGEWAIAMGMPVEQANREFGNIADMQAMTGAINKLVASAVRQTDAQPAVKQIEMMRQSYPQIDQTGEGAQKLIDIMKKQADLSIEKANQWNNFKEAGGSPSDYAKFENYWNSKVAPKFRPNYDTERKSESPVTPVEQTKVLNGKTYVKRGGSWYEQ